MEPWPPLKKGEQGNRWLVLGDLLSRSLVLSWRRLGKDLVASSIV